MSESKHTPGPWVIEGTRVMAPNAKTDWDDVVCVIDAQSAMSGNSHSDLILIAAAPQLFGALSELVGSIRDVQSAQRDPKQKQRLVARLDAAVVTASAVLTKATGEAT